MTITFKLTVNQARRLETNSAPDIARLFKAAYEKELRRPQRATDEALISASVAISLQQAVAIRECYSRLTYAATDREIYYLIQHALDKSRGV